MSMTAADYAGPIWRGEPAANLGTSKFASRQDTLRHDQPQRDDPRLAPPFRRPIVKRPEPAREAIRRRTQMRNVRSNRSGFLFGPQNKARLIQAYLQLFVYITRHGTYIDGFAAPQDAKHIHTWAAKPLLELEPKRIRDIWLCDLSPNSKGSAG